MKKRTDFSVDLAKYCACLSYPETSWGRLRLWLINHGLRCVALYRFGQSVERLYARNKLLGFFPRVAHRLLYRRMVLRLHVEIDRRARIGRGLLFMHYSGIFIGPVTIGENCTIHHNVTIGQRVAAGDQGVPTIGRDVWIGPGCIITGGIAIGDGATISAGSVVSKDVPERCLVAGNPGRVIMQDYDNSAMLGFKVAEQG